MLTGKGWETKSHVPWGEAIKYLLEGHVEAGLVNTFLNFLFGVGAGVFTALIGANLALIYARITHHDGLARRIVDFSSRFTRFLKLGDDGDTQRHRSADGHLRA